jgi:hypothetical protein
MKPEMWMRALAYVETNIFSMTWRPMFNKTGAIISSRMKIATCEWTWRDMTVTQQIKT